MSIEKVNNLATSEDLFDFDGFWKRLLSVYPERSVPEIAKILGYERQTLYKWRDGKAYPTIEKLLAISQSTNSSLDWLMTGNGEMRPEVQPENLIQETTSDSADEEEFAAMFYNYRDLTEEDKEELRGLMVYVDHEITRRKKRREKNPRTADPARMESTRSHKR